MSSKEVKSGEQTADVQDLARFGYTQELRRVLGVYSSFAVAFSYISPSTGIFTLFALSLAIGRALGSMLFGITPTDKPTYLGVFALLAVVALIACYLPARRAARIDPTQALRQE